MTIWKFPLESKSLSADGVMLMMPSGATVLSFQTQDGIPTVWALVDPDAPLVPHTIKIRLTGENFEPYGRFIGTVQVLDGGIVLHAYHEGSL